MNATEPVTQLDGSNGRKIVIVDDSDELRELYQLVLMSHGYDIKGASGAERALEIVRTWRPDLVLTDLFMPGMGGLELITRLRSDLTPPLPPIIVISGFPDAKDDALRRGATRFETKPLTPSELTQLVADAFDTERAPRTRSPDVIRERRAASRTIGEATLTRHLTGDPGLLTRVATQAHALARFFDGCPTLTFALRGGRLVLTASSAPAVPLTVDVAEVLPLMNDVVESAESLVVSQVTSSWLAESRGATSIRFLVAVPYVLDRAACGAICLVDHVPRNFGSAELGILEYLAHRGSAVLQGGPRLMDDAGLPERGTFCAFLSGSVKTAYDAGTAFGLTLVEAPALPRDESLLELFADLPGPRVMVGVVAQRRVAVFAIADSSDLVRERLRATREALEARTAVSAIAELTYEDPVPRADAELYLARAEELLARAIAQRGEAPQGFMAIDARRR